MRVLFVDDENSVRELLSAFCEILEIGYATAANTEDALCNLEKEGFSLIVTDIEMPGLNGIYLANEVRRRYPQSGVFAFSGSLFQEHEARQYSQLFDKIFQKPHDYSRLMAEIMKYIALKKYPFLA